MSTIPPFPPATVKALADLLGEATTGSKLDAVFAALGIEDVSGESTKWKRLHNAILEMQRKQGAANGALALTTAILDPAGFVTDSRSYDEYRERANAILAFSGIEIRPDGKAVGREAAVSLRQAEHRLRTIEAKFSGRRMHPEVLKYCSAELLQDNYFHAVFEATKGLAQRIRDLSGVRGDGAVLVDVVFSVKAPILALNSLQSETEQSEHKGFAALLKGCFGAVRNPLAHEPKILWDGEDDAADYLTLISLLHRKLDDCVKTGYEVAS